MRLKDKVAIITGSAGGMGQAAAELFASEGASIVVADVVSDAGEETARKIRDAGGKAIFVTANVAKEEEVKNMVGAAIDAFGHVDVLYNNAGIMPSDDGSVTGTASKGAMIALTKSFAVQYGRHGIRCNAICPGPIETPLLRFLWTSEEARNLRLDRIPLGRFGEAKDIIYLALYLASDESSWTTGAWLVVDGGISSNYF